MSKTEIYHIDATQKFYDAVKHELKMTIKEYEDYASITMGMPVKLSKAKHGKALVDFQPDDNVDTFKMFLELATVGKQLKDAGLA